MDKVTLLLNLVTDGFVTGCLYGLVAVGFSLLWWLADIVHLAHAGVLLVAGYAAFVAMVALGVPAPFAVPVAVAAAIPIGLVIERLVYRPLAARRAGETGVLTASLAVLIILEYALTLAFGPAGVTADSDLRVPLLQEGGIVLDRFAALVFATTAVVFAALTFLLRRTQIGRSMRAVAENGSLAEVLGIPIRRIHMVGHALAAALVAPAAVFLLFNTGVHPYEALHIALIAAVVAIIGGRGSIAGALLGGVLIGVAESVMLWSFQAGWRQLITFGLLYILLLVRPQGLLGARP